MAPDLVQTHLKYRNQGVQFIGLSSESDLELENIERFVEKYDTRWPIGYAAYETMEALGAQYLPSVVVVGRDGRVVGAYQGVHSAGDLGRLIDKALAAN